MNSILQDVLTLDEVAKYLRLPKETIERQAIQGKIPGRRIEESWRSLKKAIDDWLQSEMKSSNEFPVRLRGEIKHGIQRRHEFSLRKLSFCVALLGLGALNKIPIGSAQILSLTYLLYLVPLVAIAFDLYIVAEDFRIKRAGEYLAKEESGSGPAERGWELFVKKHDNPFAPWAFFIVTVILLIGAILLLLKASHNILFISIWGGVLLSTEIYLLWYSLHLRSKWGSKMN